MARISMMENSMFDVVSYGMLGRIIPDIAGRKAFNKAFDEAKGSHASRCAVGWAHLDSEGYSPNLDGIWKKIEAGSAKPMYGKRSLLNADELLEWAKEQGFKTALVASELHTTFMYSKTPIIVDMEDWSIMDGNTFSAKGGNRMVVQMGDNAVALVFDSTELVRDWLHMRERFSASWDWPSFIPHITITYDGSDVDLSSIEPFLGDLVFGPMEIRPAMDGAIDAIAETVLKFEPSTDMFSDREGAVARSQDIGLNGTVHVALSGGQAFFRPGMNEQAYVAAANPNDTSDGGLSLISAVAGLMGSIKDVLSITKFSSADNDLLLSGITKVDEEQRIVWGWASVSTLNGELVEDLQGDVVEPSVMVKAANEFMLDVRDGKVMHDGGAVGTVLHSLPVTKELGEALGIQTNIEGWVIGMKVHDDKIWELAKSGVFKGFSIGGRAKRHEI